MTVQVAGPIEYEDQMLDGIKRASGDSNSNPLLRPIQKWFPMLSSIVALTQPTRRSLDIRLAVDAGDSTSAALVAVGLSRLSDNPSSLATSLSQQGMQAAADDLNVSLS